MEPDDYSSESDASDYENDDLGFSSDDEDEDELDEDLVEEPKDTKFEKQVYSKINLHKIVPPLLPNLLGVYHVFTTIYASFLWSYWTDFKFFHVSPQFSIFRRVIFNFGNQIQAFFNEEGFSSDVRNYHGNSDEPTGGGIKWEALAGEGQSNSTRF